MYKGVNPVFAPETPSMADNGELEVSTPKMENENDSGFVSLVKSGNRSDIRDHFLQLTASGVHICISELENSEVVMNEFIGFLASEMESGKNLDLVATWTALFLQQFGSVIASRNTLFGENLMKLNQASKKATLKFETQTNQLQCLIKVTAALQLHR
jgi:hypothetical protein